MNRAFLERWKPAARARTQVLLAALLWSVVGGGLTLAGARWTLGTAGAWAPLLLAGAAVLGVVKGRLALDRTATRIAARIAHRGDGTCLGGFLSWKTWLFVGAMMGGGALLRRSPLPRPALGVVYAAVGVGLIWGSRRFWQAWQRAG